MHPDFHHRRRFTRWVLALIIVALVLWASHLEYEAGAQEWPPPGRGDNCTEDMECWDCTTMGNRICGPIPVPAEPTFTG